MLKRKLFHKNITYFSYFRPELKSLFIFILVIISIMLFLFTYWNWNFQTFKLKFLQNDKETWFFQKVVDFMIVQLKWEKNNTNFLIKEYKKKFLLLERAVSTCEYLRWVCFIFKQQLSVQNFQHIFINAWIVYWIGYLIRNICGNIFWWICFTPLSISCVLFNGGGGSNLFNYIKINSWTCYFR